MRDTKMTTKYQLYIVKKFYEPITIEANDPLEAEEKAYDWIEKNNEDNRYTSDDTYIYLDGEIE
jgi:hypothetical protein